MPFLPPNQQRQSTEGITMCSNGRKKRGCHTNWEKETKLTDITRLAHTHTHNHTTALCPGLPGWACTRKVKQSGFYWSKGQWVAVASAEPHASLHLTPDRANHASTPLLSFFTMPFLLPNKQCQNTEGKNLNMNWFKETFLIISGKLKHKKNILSFVRTSPLTLGLAPWARSTEAAS